MKHERAVQCALLFFAPTQAHGCRQMSTTVVSRMRSADLVFHDSAGNLGTTSTAGVNITIQQIPEPAFASSSPPPQLACVELCSPPERDHTPLLLATTAACLRGAMFIARTRSHTPAPRHHRSLPAWSYVHHQNAIAHPSSSPPPQLACVEQCSSPERDHTPCSSSPPQLACVELCSSPERDHTPLLLVTTAACLRGTLFITRMRSKKNPVTKAACLRGTLFTNDVARQGSSSYPGKPGSDVRSHQFDLVVNTSRSGQARIVDDRHRFGKK